MFERIVILAPEEKESASRLHEAAAGLGGGSARIATVHLAHRSLGAGHTIDDTLALVVAENADVVILGAHRQAVARRVAMLAPCSMLMIPDSAPFTLRHVLVAVDFSEVSSEAVAEAARLVESVRGSSLTVAAVETDDDVWLDWHDYPFRLQAKLEEFAAAQSGGARVECVVEPASTTPAQRSEEGETAASIVRLAERVGACLVVVGTRGRTRAAAVLLGSVTETVVELSPLPLLTVRRHGGQLGLLRGLLERMGHGTPLVASWSAKHKELDMKPRVSLDAICHLHDVMGSSGVPRNESTVEQRRRLQMQIQRKQGEIEARSERLEQLGGAPAVRSRSRLGRWLGRFSLQASEPTPE